MVPPGMEKAFMSEMEKMEISLNVMIQDVQNAINLEKVPERY